MIDFRKVIRSFGFAGQGILDLFRFENNAKVHLLVAGLVLAGGFWVQLTHIEWTIILTQIGLVWAAEAFNTAIEKLCDFVSPGIHPQIKAIKDLSSGAVLILVIAAVLVGIIIFGSHLLNDFLSMTNNSRLWFSIPFDPTLACF
ncbi:MULTISPECIES: diacylglycerol kinase family protein [unclassified Spirosoma]|uniref:diacylglycerol kinase family protein n=1 Tax=unclassified Spirosoma TaxID=2621999 RepID=UPI000963F62E|nr:MULTISPECIES: diacylglycerol kinase family protein [unclassified Spirosoma]MBN8823583.1 diacylglycerol kinase family protein [Spirosoma sp.]OJW76857.1 MAG: diacylglycerol kinase [Spirosoma sp. 48-14]